MPQSGSDPTIGLLPQVWLTTNSRREADEDQSLGLLAQALICELGVPLSWKTIQEQLLVVSSLTPAQIQEILETDVARVKRHSWYLVKRRPQSIAAKAVAGQLATVEAFEPLMQTVSIVTIDMLITRTGTAIRTPITDLTNRD